jgi:rubrerythrin
MRSRAAAAMLEGAGFRSAVNMRGGIRAWEGAQAEGLPEAGMALFPDAASPEELVALSWLMEEGTGTFYRAMGEKAGDDETKRLLRQLTAAEEHHKALLLGLYRDITGGEPGPGFPGSVLRTEPEEERMEGGVSVSEAVAWARDKDMGTVIELLMSLETNAYDLYIKMERRMDDEKSKEVFRTLYDEEHTHLKRLSRALEARQSL